MVDVPADLPGDDEPEEGQRKDTRSFFEIIEKEERADWRELPRLVLASLRLVWEAGRREFLLTAGLQLVVAAGTAAELFIARSVLSAVLGADGLSAILPPVAALVAVTVAVELVQALEAERTRILGELVGRRALDRVLDVSTSVDLLAFEEPDFYDRLRRAHFQGQFRSFQIVQGLLGLVGALTAAGGIVAALTAFSPLLVPLLLAGYVPLWIVAARNSRDLYRFMHGMTPNDRERMYLQSILVERSPAKEVRAFQLAPLIRARYDRLYDERFAELRALARRRTGRALAGSLASSGMTAIAVGVLAWLYVEGHLSLAAAGASVFGLYQLSGRLRAVHFSAASLYEATLFIRDYTSFLDLGAVDRGVPSARSAPAGFGRVAVEGVTFTYPGASRPALADVSVAVSAGEIVALVGENGSGKTTLAKLIAGLYRPESGRVLWDGVDSADIEPDELRRRIALIFQDFERYRLSARDNIGLGRHERIDDADAIAAAARRADADGFLERLPDGYETVLGREFWGGYDLSIGQWQRIALARAFFRDASLVILDEPTAALDARAESRLFERMRELLEGRAAVLISHRFSSVRSADRIYVLSHGRVVEQGTHDELVGGDGLYADLFALQAAAYLGETARLD
jgi:ATP-binding cassette subfamily B protein